MPTHKKLAKQTGDNVVAARELAHRTKQACAGIKAKEAAGERITYYGKPPGKIDVQV